MPDFIPDLVPIVLRFPATTAVALQQVQEARARSTEHQLWFDRLIPVEPQPSRDYAVVLGVPDWAHEQHLVFFDCTAVNGRAYSIIVPDVVNPDDLRRLAGFPQQQVINVFVGEFDRPVPELHRNRRFMRTGLLVLFDRGGPPRHGIFQSLAQMLQTPIGWNAAVALPRPSGLFVTMLTDTGPLFFEILEERRANLHADTAAVIGCHL